MGTRGVVLALVISTYLQVFYYLFQSARLIGRKITDLVPFVYLLKLFLLLGILYFVLSLTKIYIDPLFYLGGMFVISTIIVLAGLYRYFFIHSKNIRMVSNTKTS